MLHRRQGLGDEHVPVAGCAERCADALHLGQCGRDGFARDDRAEQTEGRSQSADGDPRLMDVFDVVAADHPAVVGDQLLQATAGDGDECVVTACCPRDHRRHRPHRYRRFRRQQREPARCLAFHADGERHVLQQAPCEREQRVRFALAKLQFQLADRLARISGHDSAAIDRELGRHAGRHFDQPCRAPEVGHEHRSQALAKYRLRGELCRRRARERSEVEQWRRERDLVFAVPMQAGLRPAAGLECLNPAPADAAQTQRHAMARQIALGCVVVDVVDAARDGSGARRGDKRRATRELAHLRRRDAQLELDLDAHGATQIADGRIGAV